MDSEALGLGSGWPTAEELIEFIDELKAADYQIGITQYIAAQDLVLALMVEGEKPENLGFMLGPLLCSTPPEQEDFQKRFANWSKKLGLSSPSTQAEPKSAEAVAFERELQQVKQQRWWVPGVLALLFALVLALVLFFVAGQFGPESPNQGPIQDPTPTLEDPTGGADLPTVECPPTSPVAPNLPERVNASGTIRRPIWASVFFIPLPIYLGFVTFWLWQAGLLLRRRPSNREPQLDRISLDGIVRDLFPSATFLRLAQGMRRRFKVASAKLDVPATVVATTQAAGQFNAVYAQRQVLPEYLVLIDKSSYGDHQARLIEATLQRLADNGVFMTRYAFKRDPQLCFPLSPTGPPRRLSELLSQYREHRLLIFADAEVFFNPLTGELRPWTAVLSEWEEPIAFTPEPRQDWGYPEQELKQFFVVLPSSVDGLTAMIKGLESGRIGYDASGSPQATLPALFRENPRRWLDRAPPEREQIEEVLFELQRYLDRAGYEWLCSCAVFPQLNWNLTLYLGQTLELGEKEPLLELRRLADLARLPWFRYADMPDWLRAPLIADLSGERERSIRLALKALLVKRGQGAVGKDVLEVASENSSVLESLGAPVLWLISWGAPRRSPLKDRLFLDFMAGRRPKLTVRMPRSAATQMPSVRLRRRRMLQWTVFASTAIGTGLWGRWLYLATRVERLASVPFELDVATVDERGGEVSRSTERAEQFVEELGGDASLEMVGISGDCFVMGSPESEIGRFSDEGPQRAVTVDPFWMGKYAVTQRQWRAVASLPKIDLDLDLDPSRFNGDDRPVETVSWEEAVEFCDRLSEATGRKYRLPSEAEWEYACRAGTTTPFHFGETVTTDLANYRGTDNEDFGWSGSYGEGPKGESREETTPVGSFQVANAFGLYDMHGNVWEWCEDRWHENYTGAPAGGTPWNEGNDSRRVLRGGSWGNYPQDCRSADRLRDAFDDRRDTIGFRVACSPASTLPF